MFNHEIAFPKNSRKLKYKIIKLYSVLIQEKFKYSNKFLNKSVLFEVFKNLPCAIDLSTCFLYQRFKIYIDNKI